MIVTELKEIMECLTMFNNKNGGSLIEEENIRDMNNTIDVFMKKYEERFYEGVKMLKEIDTNAVLYSNNPNYILAFYNLLTGIRGIVDCFDDLDEVLVNFNKKIMYQSGEITKEELENTDMIILDNEEDELGD